MARRGIHVETVVRAPLERVWAATQDPVQHVRWDVRFSRIVATDTTDAGATRFAYTRRTPLHTIEGVGVSIGEVARPDGLRTSALRFSTTDRLSPIRSGRGYWRYTPTADGVRFVTGYDYEPGWGVLDVIVRPLLGWATAWSFDRLRIWVEDGIPPERWPLWSALLLWRRDRPRAGRCRRAPAGGTRRADPLGGAPETLAALPDPGAGR